MLLKAPITETNHHIEVEIEYTRHYKSQLIYFLPHFSVQFILKSGFKSRVGYNGTGMVFIGIFFTIFHQLNEKFVVMVLITFGADLELAGIT